ncbi:MAG: tetratricopeptide repeat protein [Phycisphaeraceae bacterium]
MNDWVDAEQHAERARAFFQSGQWDHALTELQRALALNPQQFEWHYGMGLTLDALKRYDEALASYELVLKLRGSDPEVLAHIGDDLIRLGRYEAAIESLERASTLDPDYEPGYCSRIIAYTKLGDHEQAEAMFYLARQTKDTCPRCFEHLGHSLLARGQVDRAIWCWQQTLKHSPDHATARALLAQAHYSRGQVERANLYFEQQIAHDPQDVPSRVGLAKLQIELDRPEDAVRSLRRIMEIDPTHAEAHYLMGDLSIQCGHVEEAEAELGMAARLDPQLHGVHLGLAQLRGIQGRYAEARDLLLIELDKPDHSPREAIALSRTLMDLHIFDEAIALLGRLIEETQPATPADRTLVATMLQHRGYALLVSGRRERGIVDCRRSLRYEPQHGATLHNLALAYLEAGDLLRATIFHKRALAVPPEDRQVRQVGHRIRRAKLAAWFQKCVDRVLRR